jgi:hypothetical protein
VPISLRHTDISNSPGGAGKIPRVASALTSLALKLLVVSSFTWAVVGSFTTS